MAVDGSARGDLKAHEKTYESFITFAKFGTLACFVVAAFVIFLIAR